VIAKRDLHLFQSILHIAHRSILISNRPPLNY